MATILGGLSIFGENQRRRGRWEWGEVAAEELGEKGRGIFGWDVKRINNQNKTKHYQFKHWEAFTLQSFGLTVRHKPSSPPLGPIAAIICGGCTMSPSAVKLRLIQPVFN